MEIQDNNQISQNPKRKYWKFVAGFLGIIIGVFVLTNVGLWLWQSYNQWQGEKRVERLAQELKRLEQENYQRAMADTYGGKTPQETLQMYIEAVEKGDYELASKYFIGEKREKELESFTGATQEFIKKYINLVKESSHKDGTYDLEKKYFSINKPIGIRMIFYPNGIWKIIEI